MTAELCSLTIAQAGAAMRRKEVSPAELTLAFLDRIAGIDPHLNAYAAVLDERARRQARRATEELYGGVDRGPLHGIPIGVKDVIDVAGAPTAHGCDSLRNEVAAASAMVVERVEAAGAVILGKHSTHQFAVCGPSYDTAFPLVRNPWNLEHYSGGSSSGSAAAVAAGLCMGAIGTDAGGSIRKPAAYCGVVGFKPSFGLVDRTGIGIVSPTLDHCGPIAHTARDASCMLAAMTGRQAPPQPCAGPMLEGVRIGIVRDFHAGAADACVADAFEQSIRILARSGATFQDIGLSPLSAYNEAYRTIFARESYDLHAERLAHGDLSYSGIVRERLLSGRAVEPEHYEAALRLGRALRLEQEAAFAECDVLLHPTDPMTAPRLSELEAGTRPASVLLTTPANVTGNSAMTVCCGFSDHGLPIGLQITGARERDAFVAHVAHVFERLRGGRGGARSTCAGNASLTGAAVLPEAPV